MTFRGYTPAVMHIETVETPFGDFVLETTSLGLVAVHLPGAPLRSGVSDTTPDPAAERHARTARGELLAYLDGELASFETPLDFSGQTLFLRDVLTTLRGVPFGVTVTYKALARLAGYPDAVRAVGGAMKRNRTPIFVPCHRVIAAGNRIGGWSGQAGWKERLLAHEGVVLSE